MRVNEDLFPSRMAKVDNENKCVESENLNFRTTNKSGDTYYKVQNSVSRSKDGDQCEEEHSFEKPHEEEAPAIKKEEAKISLTEWVKNIKMTSCPYVKEEPERSGSMEIVILDGRLPRMANILFFQPEVVDGWMEVAEARKKMISWNNYCPPPKNIIREYQLLGICLPWKPGDQEQKIIAQNYRLLGDYFPWDPGGQSCNCIKYCSR